LKTWKIHAKNLEDFTRSHVKCQRRREDWRQKRAG